MRLRGNNIALGVCSGFGSSSSTLVRSAWESVCICLCVCVCVSREKRRPHTRFLEKSKTEKGFGKEKALGWRRLDRRSLRDVQQV